MKEFEKLLAKQATSTPIIKTVEEDHMSILKQNIAHVSLWMWLIIAL